MQWSIPDPEARSRHVSSPGIHEGTTAIQPSTECLHHPTSDQAHMSSGSTPTRRPRHHLRSSAQELGFQPWLDGPDVTSRVTDKPDSPSILEASGRLLQHSSAAGLSELPYQISTVQSIEQILSSINKSYLQPTDQVVTANKSSSYD